MLHAFGSGDDGEGVWGSIVLDKNGNVYGATTGGGAYGKGTVFELSPQGAGQWTETVLYSFCPNPNCPDGNGPFGGPTFDGEGNLYGTTQFGGTNGYPGGTVYQLVQKIQGWTETVLYSFCGKAGCSDGAIPWGAVTLDRAGNVFGTAEVAFELPAHNPAAGSEVMLHNFADKNGDGYDPYAGPILDAAGNLYGTTQYGGSYNAGIIYQLQPVRSSVEGVWKENILHTFRAFPGDGIRPGLGSLTMDSKGNLYGATMQGGALDSGVVYKLSPQPDGTWQESILYNFTAAAWGSSGVIFGLNGNLYGTAINGGGWDCGVIYELSPTLPTPNSQWQYTLLHSFNGSDGCQPDANLTLGPDGNLYGTTVTGGAAGAGVVFEITP